MSVRYEDYYKRLGVTRSASQDEIQKAFRKQARKYHPDISNEPDAEDNFKAVNEAYEVLRDPAKRKQYDALGNNWKAGQRMSTPNGWEEFMRRQQAGNFGRTSAGGFSDFFEAFFGGPGAGGFGGGGFGGQSNPFRSGGGQRAPQKLNQEAEITVSLREVHYGVSKSITLQSMDPDGRGGWKTQTRTYQVKIPPGTTHGKVLRLAGEGATQSQGNSGDLLLKVNIAEDPDFEVDGHDLQASISIKPWQAVLGGTIEVPTLGGSVKLRVPAGVQVGQRLRLRGQGLRQRHNVRGDLYVVVQVQIPRELSDKQRELYEELSKLET